MKSKTLYFLLISALFFSQHAFAKKSLSAHEHGSATISLAYEQNSAEIELESPADSLLGFEHAPKSDKEKKAFESAKNLWGNLSTELIIFAKDLNCKTTNVVFKQIMSQDEHDDHKKHDHHDKDHSDDSHSEIEASAKVVCEKAISGDVTVQLRKHFKKMKNVKLEIVGTKSQSLKIKKDIEIIKL